MNFKKLKIRKSYRGVSLVELMVALSIFALIATVGFSAFSFMLKTQHDNQSDLEKNLLHEARASACIKKIYYAACMQSDVPNCSTNIQQAITDCHNAN